MGGLVWLQFKVFAQIFYNTNNCSKAFHILHYKLTLDQLNMALATEAYVSGAGWDGLCQMSKVCLLCVNANLTCENDLLSKYLQNNITNVTITDKMINYS